MIKHWRPAAVMLAAVVVLATVLATAGTVFGFPSMGHRDSGRDNERAVRPADDDDLELDGSLGSAVFPNEATVGGLLSKAVDKGLITRSESDQLLQWVQSRPEALMLTGQDLMQVWGWWQAKPAAVMKLAGKLHAAMNSPEGTMPGGFTIPEGITFPIDDATVEALLALAATDHLITQAQAGELMQWWQARPEALKVTQADVDAIAQWVEARPPVVDRLARVHGLGALAQLAPMGQGLTPGLLMGLAR